MHVSCHHDQSIWEIRAHRIAASVTLLWCLPLALADPTDGYCDAVDATDSTTLRTTLHAVIDDHLRFPYTSSSTDFALTRAVLGSP